MGVPDDSQFMCRPDILELKEAAIMHGLMAYSWWC